MSVKTSCEVAQRAPPKSMSEPEIAPSADAAAAADADASRRTQHSSSSSSSGGGGLGWQALEGRVRQNLRSAAPSGLSTSSSSSEEDEARWG